MKVYTKQDKTWGLLRTDSPPKVLMVVCKGFFIFTCVAAVFIFFFLLANESGFLPSLVCSGILVGLGSLLLVMRNRAYKAWERFCEEMRQHEENELQAESAKHQNLLKDVEQHTWIFPVELFEKKCNEYGISSISAETQYQRARIVASEVLVEKNIPTEFHDYYISKAQIYSYFEGIEKLKIARAEAELQKRMPQLLSEENAFEAKCLRYTNDVGREKSIHICQDEISSCKQILDGSSDRVSAALNDKNTTYKHLKQDEHDWAIHGGIASGLAGGAAGVATAVNVQQKNASIRQQNTNLNSALTQVSNLLIMNEIQTGVSIQRSFERWIEEEKKAKVALVDFRDENKLISLLHLYVKNYENTPTGAVKLQIGFHTTPNLMIFENTPAVVDGSIKVLLKQSGVVVGTAICALPYKGAVSQGHMECICRNLSQKAASFDFEFEPLHLWLVETERDLTYDTWTRATAEDFLLDLEKIDAQIYEYVANAEKITVNEILNLMIAQHPFLENKSQDKQLKAYKASLLRLVDAGRIEQFMENATYYYKVI